MVTDAMAHEFDCLSELGGGFMPQSHQVQQMTQRPAPASTASGLSRKSDKGGKTLRFVTFKQLAELCEGSNAQADRDSNGDFIVDGQLIDALDVICVLGKVIEVHQTSTKAVFTVHDGSGVRDVTWPFGTDVSGTVWVPELLQVLRDAVANGQPRYVCAHCWPRTCGSDRYLLAMSIRLVTDINEVTHHGLRVIFEHLWIKKQAEDMENDLEEQVMKSTQQAATQAGAAQQLAPPTPEKSQSSRPGFNRLRDAVWQALARPQALSNGMTTDEVLSHLGSRWNRNAIASALAWMEDEGHAFRAPDGEHYCSATN